MLERLMRLMRLVLRARLVLKHLWAPPPPCMQWGRRVWEMQWGRQEWRARM